MGTDDPVYDIVVERDGAPTPVDGVYPDPSKVMLVGHVTLEDQENVPAGRMTVPPLGHAETADWTSEEDPSVV